jgi:hypothetical protein
MNDESQPLLDLGALDSDVEERAEPNYRAMAVAWVVTATLVRLACVARLPLGNGEAYYYSWSRFLDWSYYDHPPLIAWLVRATTLFGATPAAVRFGPVLASGAFGYLLYRLAERFFRPRAAFFALVLVTALPVFLVSSFVVNPEAPLAPLWVGFLLVIESMRKRDEWHRPLLAGALLGFAFLAKYTAVLVYFAFSSTSRRWLRRPSFYAGGAIALLLAVPVLAWNQARGWPSLQLQLVDRATAAVPVAGENTVNHLVEIASSNGTSFLGSIVRVAVGQALSYSPLLAPLLVLGLVHTFRRARNDDRYLYLTAFTLPVLLPLLAAMVKLKDAEQHWTMMAFVPAVIAAGYCVDEAWSGLSGFRVKLVRGLAIAGVALSAAAFVLGNVHARSAAFLDVIPSAHYDARADMVNELIGWDQVRPSLAQAAGAARGNVVLASNHYSLCGRMLFEMGDWPPVYCPTAKRSAFDFWGRSQPPADATVIALTTNIHEELPYGLSGRNCALADEVDVERAGHPVARYFVHSCRPMPSDSDMSASR